MDCFCGCGTRLPSRLTEVNLLASRMALELLAWDKARTGGRLGVDAPELESLISRGENAYQRLLLLLHDEGGPAAVDECEGWIKESFDQRLGRDEITDRGSFFSRPKLRLGDDDYAVLDRRRPGQSFSRHSSAKGPGADVADQLERLGRLHADGVLSDEEFAAAKGRVLGARD
jgi:hypothetical protein